MRVAAIDIGTNSVLLVIAERADSGIHVLCDRATITRLGQAVDQSGVLSAQAEQRTLACLRDYAREIRDAQVTQVDVVGTSAMRDARGGDAFSRKAETILGVRPRVIDGLEEARLTFAGALSGLTATGNVVVFDVGGGSTEVIEGEVAAGSRRLAKAQSLNIGSVRLFERHLHSDPPKPAEIAAVRSDIRAALAPLMRPPPSSTWIGVAGTVTTLAALQLALPTYVGSRVHGARLTTAAVGSLANRLAALDLAHRRALQGLAPDRADVIVAGACIVAELLAWGGASSLIASDRGVRWGLVLELFERLP